MPLKFLLKKQLSQILKKVLTFKAGPVSLLNQQHLNKIGMLVQKRLIGLKMLFVNVLMFLAFQMLLSVMRLILKVTHLFLLKLLVQPVSLSVIRLLGELTLKRVLVRMLFLKELPRIFLLFAKAMPHVAVFNSAALLGTMLAASTILMSVLVTVHLNDKLELPIL